MSDDIHQLASDFLNDYLRKHGGSTDVSVVSTRPRRIVENRTAALEFIRQLRKSRLERPQAARYEIDPPEQVILARSISRAAPYLYGWKYGQPVFTHDSRLALVVDSDEATRVQDALKDNGIGVTALPAPATADKGGF